MSLVAPRYHQDAFPQVDRRRTVRNTTSSVVDQMEHLRSLSEDSQASAVAAQAELMSLQVQLDKAQIELVAKDKSIKSLTEQCTIFRSLMTEKDEKLEQFTQKLSAIKAGLRKEQEKQRGTDKDMRQVALDCVLRCSRELCTQAITREEFQSSVDLILSTLTPHPNLPATPSSSCEGEVEFGEEGRKKLEQMSLSERREHLATLMTSTTCSSPTTVHVRDDIDTPSPPPPPPRPPRSLPGNREKERHREYESIDSNAASRRCHGEVGVAKRDSLRRRKMRYCSSEHLLVSKGDAEECDVRVMEDYPGGQVHVWKKKLGLKEGSVYTGSLPDLKREEEMEGEEEDEGGDDEYIDPRDIASAFISPKLSRRVSQRLLKRMDTMMNQATPTYLKIISTEGERCPLSPNGAISCCTTEDDLSSVDWDAGDEAEHVTSNPAPNHTPQLNSSTKSNSHRDHTHILRRRQSHRVTAIIEGDSDEDGSNIYECIDELSLPTCDIRGEVGANQFKIPQHIPLPRRRSKVTTNRRRQRYSKMKGLDGYEYLDLSPTGDGATIPRWHELSPALPPPRKSTLQPTPEHPPLEATLSVPLDTSYVSHSPAISSDETNQSDSEIRPELLYTTPCFVTMESRPQGVEEEMEEDVEEEGEKKSRSLYRPRGLRVTHTDISPNQEETKRGRQEKRHHTQLHAKRSHTLPISSAPRPLLKGVDHCGYLTKYDPRLRPGKRRWFVLAGQELRYYRSKEVSLNRPRRVINLNSWCKLAIVNEVIFKLMTSTQTYHLSGGTEKESEEWIQALKGVLRRPSVTGSHLHTTTQQSPSSPPPPPPPLSGWVHMSENAETKKVWCELDSEGTLSISEQPQTEVKQRVNVGNSTVRKVRDSLLMDNKNSSSCLSSQLTIQEEGAESPLLLVPCNLDEKETWFYQLNLTSHRGRNGDVELSPTEQTLAVIFREGGALDHPQWKHPVLNKTDSHLKASLTSLSSPSLISKAFRLFQNVQMFMSTPLSPLALECHVTAIQHIIGTCLRHHELRDELYCQLLRQLAGSPGQVVVLDRLLQQGWCLLSLIIPMFLPRQHRINQYLNLSLQRGQANSIPLLSKFSQHCQEMVKRVRETGERKWRPSAQELEDLLSHFATNPTSLKICLSIPVHLPDGTSKDVEFDASSTVDELLTQLNAKLGMPPSLETGFSLMSDWPGVEECAFFQLPVTGKLGDLLACWWNAMDELSNSSTSRGGGRGGGGAKHRCIRLTYRNRLFVRSHHGDEVEREAELLAYQISHEVVSGRHRVSSNKEAIQMAAIMAQLEFGDWDKVGVDEEGEEGGEERQSVVAREALIKFGPMRLTQMTLEHDISLYQQWLTEWWSLNRGKTRVQCAREFLDLALQWQLCGATLFLAEKGHGRNVWLAVHEEGVSLLSPSSMDSLATYSWSQLTAFGSDIDNLVLVVTSSQNSSHGNTETEKILLFMSKAKIHQATNLMTSYLERRTKIE